jgi:hypothetical protein
MPIQLNLDVEKKQRTNNIITIVREVDGFNIIIIIIHWFQHQPWDSETRLWTSDSHAPTDKKTSRTNPTYF